MVTNISERRFLAISVKHSEYRWKFGMPLTLWGWHRTADDEPRCYADYTQYPNRAELYSMTEFEKQYGNYFNLYKYDEPVHISPDFCKKYRKFDTVFIDIDEYIGYCKCACLPLDKSKEGDC